VATRSSAAIPALSGSWYSGHEGRGRGDAALCNDSWGGIEAVLSRFRKSLSYSNVTATAALFVALGGTSYAVIGVGSDDVVNNSLRSSDLRDNTVRSKDIRDRTIRARDVRRDGLGGGVVKEASLGRVPRAADSERVGGATAENLRIRCPSDTLQRAGVCIERAVRGPAGFLGASSTCDNAGRGLPTMAQLDRFARSQGPLSAQGEWTSSVYRNPDNGPDPFDQLETVILSGGANAGYERVNLAVQHAFRCVALPSN
jgi:hypothetical protein